MGLVYSFQPLHTYFHHNQHKTPKWFLHSIVTSETKTSKTQEAIAEGEIISTIVHEHEFAITTKLVELKINERDEPHIVVDDGDNDFTFLVVDSVLRVDREEKKYVLAPVVISDTAVVFAEEHKRHVTEPLKNVVTATTMPSTEKKVMRAVTVRLGNICTLPSSYMMFPFTSLISVEGLQSLSAPAACRRQFRNITSYGILFPTTAPSPSHHWSVSLLSLVWEPWDRGKINWNTMDFSFRRRQHTFYVNN
ncbi:hypothetical protein P8452_08432 [Trifolium repens]|nr:hypothetical protein P8452_08432 [Trifolium repens]